MAEERHSISSKSSWMRRLSYIAHSQHGSPRSSVGPDSPSITFSHGSAAPMLHSGFSPVHQEPNKLVKRAPSVRGASGHSFSNPTSNARQPTLRRPATSHQRSMTLQQQYHDAETSQPRTPIEADGPFATKQELTPAPSSWRPYFESCPTRVARDRHGAASTEIRTEGFYSTSNRVLVPDGVLPTLMKPSMVDCTAKKVSNSRTRARSSTVGGEAPNRYPTFRRQAEIPKEEPEKRTRQSISMHFTSPTWMNKTGSLRIKKGREIDRGTIGRALSVPLSSSPPPITAGDCENKNGRAISDQVVTVSATYTHADPPRPLTPNNINGSSTLPPISRLSSFNIDYGGTSRSSTRDTGSRATSNSTSTSHDIQSTARAVDSRARALSSHPVILHQSLPLKPIEVNNSDQGSTLVGSEPDLKGFVNVEDEEIDFQSETAWDSLRTGATGSLRARSAALDSMFEESPPSSGSRSKPSEFHEGSLFPAFHNHGGGIVEEDEGMETPVKNRRRFDDVHRTPTGEILDFGDETLQSSASGLRALPADLFRVSSADDDDFDEDWTRDDDDFTLTSALSPPSNSINSQRVSKALRAQLAGNADFEGLNEDPHTGGRPRSVFDWSESQSYMHEKLDVMGNLPRPSTVHGKQFMDGRGGRAASRSHPTALHIRSQSVPAVPDINGQRDTKTLGTKFGTWGLGAKPCSEDWDNDFDFDNNDEEDEDNQTSPLKSAKSMVVPPAIQASQASVVGHVGQIREVCLLVEDLRRLRGLAREKGIIDGPSADKWREAEGIIALAIPDEEDETLSPPLSPSAHSANSDNKRLGHNTSMSVDTFSLHDAAMNKEYQSSLEKSQRSQAGTRRQSILTVEDDIFGLGLPRSSSDSQRSKQRSQAAHKENAEVARSVMEKMHQHRASSDPILQHAISEKTSKMPFDTTSLRDLVQRANALTRALSEIIRKADGFTHSPQQNSEIFRDGSPAFTRVFTDPLASPPKTMTRSQSDTAMINGTINSSPTRNLAQRMHMMAVG